MYTNLTNFPALPEQQENPNDEINVRFTDEQIDKLLGVTPPEEEKGFGIAAGPVYFSLDPTALVRKRVKVDVLLCGIPVGSIVLTENDLEQTIGPNLGAVKATITLTVNWDQHQITYVSRACARNWRLQWKCATHGPAQLFSW